MENEELGAAGVNDTAVDPDKDAQIAAGSQLPPQEVSAAAKVVEYFGDPNEDDDDPDDDAVSFTPSTANEKDGTIDCVWYAGATVPRQDPETYEPYMLSLDMEGCR